jgi:SAM-dependent methyltransferase
MESADAATFDESYYDRFYFDKKTRVADRLHVERLGAFVSSYLQYLRVPVHRVLDIGCGVGLWRDIVMRHFPQASYHGVEVSDYLCRRYGWERGSVVDHAAAKPFDFVICQGVLAYLSPADLKQALRNLGTLSHGALYVEAVTLEDYQNDVVDEELTDPLLFRHRAEVYRRGLSRNFRNLGGGVWLARRAEVPVFTLECAPE